jgi:hypothetical protein
VMDILQNIEQSGFASWVRESPSIFAFPSILLLHTIGMAFVAAVAAGINLRILGVAPAIPLAPLQKFLPVLWFGFLINAITGTMLLTSDISLKLTNPDFYVKMAFIALSLILLRMMRREVFGSPEAETGKFSSRSKWLAWASLFCWLVVIVSGRLLAYVGNSSSYK